MENYLKKAEEIAYKAHDGQTRFDGVTPYIKHVESVVRLLTNQSETVLAAAWLHDVVEDNPNYSFDSFRQSGIPEEVINIVTLLTKQPGVDYFEYIQKISENPLAKTIKIADIISNLSDSPSRKQVRKYAEALKYLQYPIESNSLSIYQKRLDKISSEIGSCFK